MGLCPDYRPLAAGCGAVPGSAAAFWQGTSAQLTRLLGIGAPLVRNSVRGGLIINLAVPRTGPMPGLVVAFRMLQRAVAFADLGADDLDRVAKHRTAKRLVRCLDAPGYAIMLRPEASHGTPACRTRPGI